MRTLISEQQLPQGFEYPPEFLRVVASGIIEFEPWQILLGIALTERQTGLTLRYPGSQLLVFAARTNNDEVACWDLEAGNVRIIHDYASPGWERRGQFADFKAWLRVAFNEFIDYE